MNERQVHALDLLLDDHFVLWDFADSFPDFRPEKPDSAVKDLIDLVHRGLIAVEFGTWFDNQTEPVSPAEAEGALLNPSNWKPTGREPGYVVAMTDKGVEHLRGLGIYSGRSA
jgi:hypothetical protein